MEIIVQLFYIFIGLYLAHWLYKQFFG